MSLERLGSSYCPLNGGKPKLVAARPHRKIFWASLLDDYNDPGFHYMGLVVSDKGYHIKQLRPSYHALKKLMRMPSESAGVPPASGLTR